MTKIIQKVDPLVEQAIKKAVDREGLVDWSLTDNVVTPKFEFPVYHMPYKSSRWAFISSFLP